MAYWDPIPTVNACVEGEPLPGLAEWVRAYDVSWDTSHDVWGERNWRNVPGPFYGAATDTCRVGRGVAPGHVLYDDEYGQEFVYRQPRTPEETYRVMAAAWQDLMAGFQRDGDEHWTPELVREWWRDRGRVREWAVGLDREWSVSERAEEREAAGGARAYVAHIDGDLGDRLRGYLFWLQEARPARPGEGLPGL
ncbi:ferredoxin [Streptomyces sp. NPDC059355]|uniref:ferredoxin n=1 Tax=Streptomyces sp. NPDC059355 TaxID=3346811 RepID=UPI00369A5802